MLNGLRSWIPQPVKKRLKLAFGLPLRRLHPDWSILRHIGPIEGRHVLIDAGSHHGWFFHCWKDWCPGAEIHAFEPDEQAVKRSIELYGSDPDLTVNSVALGAKSGLRHFHLMPEARVSSSFLEPIPEAWQTIQFKTGEMRVMEVPVMRLDDYVKQHAVESVYLLKIDVQGFEEEVLVGAEETLRHTSHIFVESAIRPLYRGAPKFSDIIDRLIDEFDLVALRSWHRGNRVLVEADLLFRRRALSPLIDPSVERIVEEL